MNNKLLGFITASILVSALSLSIGAAPSVAEASDSVLETDATANFSQDILTEEDSTAWTGSTAQYFSAGIGTEDYPYIVKTAEELALLARLVNEENDVFGKAFYLLGADINLGERAWNPIGASAVTPFGGCFDGGGHKIEGLRLTENEYTGLFGYILNGTVKNLSVENFVLDLSPEASPSYSSMYAGALAGFISAVNGESNIFAVCVTNGAITFNGSVDNLFAGSITGYGYSNSTARVNIFDCYANSSITAENASGFNCIGGLAGKLTTGSTSLTSLVHCFSTGSVSSSCDHTSRAGGLVGYLYSHGSAYASSGSASLLASDKDIMIINSFSVTDVYSLSKEYTSYAGYLIGECNAYAGIKNALYPSSGTTVKADYSDSTMRIVTETTGTAIAPSNFKSQSYLANSRGFDFTSVWGISADLNSGYPYLLCTAAEKAEITSVDISIGAKSADSNIRYLEADGLQYPLYERGDNLVRIVPKKDLLIEIVEKESEAALGTVSTKYYFVDFETMTYREISKLNSFMDNRKTASIRTKDPVSIRYTSGISTSAKREESDFVITEYGFIVGANKVLGSSQLNFDFSKYSTGVSFSRKDNIDLVFDSSDDELCVFTGILVNIPEAHYGSLFTSKNYAKISLEGNEFIIYGEPVLTSLYDVAIKHLPSLDENDPKREELQKIVDTVDGVQNT